MIGIALPEWGTKNARPFIEVVSIKKGCEDWEYEFRRKKHNSIRANIIFFDDIMRMVNRYTEVSIITES